MDEPQGTLMVGAERMADEQPARWPTASRFWRAWEASSRLAG